MNPHPMIEGLLEADSSLFVQSPESTIGEDAMNPTKARTGSAKFDTTSDALLWAVVGLPMAVESSRAILEEIHGAVQEGMRQLSRGGMEVGGVLFGRRTEGAIRIMAWRPISCEHAKGPTFSLSNNDTQNLMQLLESAARDPQLQVLEPVGWFVSHTRSGVAMTTEDFEIYQKFFPEPWQVTLVLHPVNQGSSRAGYFMRERDGKMRTESSYREFSVDNVRYATAAVTEPAVAPVVKVRPVAKPAPVAPPRLTMESSGGGHRRVAFAAAALLLGALALFAVPKIRHMQPGDAPLQLRMDDAKGQLRIEWDRNNLAVRDGDGATLYITDGGKLSPVKLDHDAALSGSLTYARASEDVIVRFVVNRSGEETYQEMARYVGPPVTKEEARELRAALDGTDAFLQEAQRLRSELEQESKRNQELAKAVRKLEEQLERETRRAN
ncbi:MAG: hypothetical protein JST93_27265 [Acidobacteria bacterium]|nr:hypothetical protein [Acidobacteriota bacterium]